jgi:hypothetical protein
MDMKWHKSAAALAALTLGGLVWSVSPATAEPYCGITWGSLAKSSPQFTGALVTGARVGQHDCWDRLVIDLNGMPAPGYTVRYTDTFTAEGTGDVLPTAGGAIITISVNAWAYDFSTGRSSVPWSVGSHIVSPTQFSASGFRTFRDLVYGGTFEGYTKIGLGVRARLPFRVFTLDGPDGASRLVIDVAHQW